MITQQIREICDQISQIYKYDYISFEIYENFGDLSDCILIKEEFEETSITYRVTSKLFEGLKEILIQKPILNNWIMNEAYKLVDYNQNLQSFMNYGINEKVFSFYNECEEIEDMI